MVILAFALMWMPIGGWQSETAKVVYVMATFLFYSTISTIIAVPYSSLSAEITTHVKERNSVNVLRLVVSTLATAICTLVPTMILEAYKGGSFGIEVFYIAVGIGFGLFFALPLILIGLFTKERVVIPQEKSIFEVKTFVKPLKVKAFRGLTYMYLCQSISMDILSAGIIYYALYVVKGSPTIFLGTFIGIQLLMFPIINKLVNEIDKKKIYYFGLPIAIIGFVGVGLYPAEWSVMGAYALTAVTALGFAGAQLMSWIIFPDAVDAGELMLKERPTGSFSGIMTFIRKTSSAIAIQIFGIMLAISGYINPTDAVPQPIQPANAQLGIRIAMSLSFVLLMTLGYIMAKRFVLTNERSLLVRKFLKFRVEGKPLTDEETEELNVLESQIF
jgi:GPH family glycoside/pentoside/hexuronide:cation symporter/oligogalacturonide transporter